LDSYTFSKWTILFVIAILGSFILSWNSNKFVLPKLDFSILAFITFLTFLTLYNHYSTHFSFFSSSFVERILFIILSILFFNLFLKKKNYYPIEVITFISLSLYLLLISPEIYKKITLNEDLITFFGNVNISAEYIGCLTSILISFNKKNLKIKKVFNFAIVLSLVFLYFHNCRSVILAISISMLCCKIFNLLTFRDITLYILGTFLIIFIIHLSINNNVLSIVGMKDSNIENKTVVIKEHNIENKKGLFTKDKEASTFERWNILLGTFKMILNHPFGIGPGEFTFGLIPYVSHIEQFNDMYITSSPHNEYLRWIAEDGIIYAVTFLLMCIFIFYKKRDKIKTIPKDCPILIGFFSFLGVQSLFQFPFLHAFPFLITACCVGLFFAHLFKDQIVFVSKNIALTFSFILLALLSMIILSQTITYLAPENPSLNNLAKKMDANNWYAAILEAHNELTHAHYTQANKIIENELLLRPNNYLALGVKADILEQQGNIAEMCTIYNKINNFFNDRSSYHKKIKAKCLTK
jgi:hypothetical protein